MGRAAEAVVLGAEAHFFARSVSPALRRGPAALAMVEEEAGSRVKPGKTMEAAARIRAAAPWFMPRTGRE